MRVSGNINGLAHLITDADSAGRSSGGGFISDSSVTTNASATGTVNFIVGNSDRIEAQGDIDLTARHGGQGGDVSDGTVVNSNAAGDYINFGKPHLLRDGASVTWTGATDGGLVQNKEYTVIVRNGETIHLGTKFGADAVDPRDTITIPNHAFVNGDQVIYNSNAANVIDGLSNGVKYQVKVIDENTIKLQTIGFTEVTDTFSRGDVSSDTIGGTNPFTNGDVVTYRPAEPRSSCRVSSMRLSTPIRKISRRAKTPRMPAGSISPNHGFSNGQAVIYRATGTPTIVVNGGADLVDGETYYVVNGGSFNGQIGAAYAFDANHIRLARTAQDAEGFIDDKGTPIPTTMFTSHRKSSTSLTAMTPRRCRSVIRCRAWANSPSAGSWRGGPIM
jgi:hypothetical protein